MDEKISLEAIALYGDSYAEKLVKGFFVRKDRITGSEILSFSNIPQINLFIVRELLKAWKDETRKLKSPYFDYENEQVKEALDGLMNALSRNITIAQPHFLPLVKKAVSQALLVIFDPYDFYSMMLTGMNNKLDVDGFAEEIRYLKVNKAPLEKMLEKLRERNVSEVSGNEALGVLDQVLEEVNFTPEDIEEYIEKFSIVAPLDPNTFFVSKPTPVSTQLPPPPSVVRQNEAVEEPPAPRRIPPEEKSEPVNTSQRSEPPKVNKPRVVEPPSSNGPAPLHERHARENRPTIAENFQKIRRIKESLTINQKFMFTKVLFHGDFELFSRAIDRLDQLDSLSAAIRYIEEEHASTWDRESEEFHEFMELVEKRFG